MIPFRTQRVATSVTNRILNVYRGLPPRQDGGELSAPAPLEEGAAVDQRLNAPKAPVDADPQTAEAVAIGGGIK